MKKSLQQKQVVYPSLNSNNSLLCMYLYGGFFYRNLPINEKINHRVKFSKN